MSLQLTSRLVLVACLSLIASPALGVIAFVDKTTPVVSDGGTGSASTTLSVTCPSANSGETLVAGGIIEDQSTTWTLSVDDGGANTWTVRTGLGHIGSARPAGVDTRTVLARSKVTTSGARTVNFVIGTPSGGLRFYKLGCAHFTGADTEDTWAHTDDQNDFTVDFSVGPITTTDAGDLLTGLVGVDSSDSTYNWSGTDPTSWTNIYSDGDCTDLCFNWGYWLPASIRSGETYQWHHDNSVSDFGLLGSGVVIAVKPAGGGGGGASPKNLMLLGVGQ